MEVDRTQTVQTRRSWWENSFPIPVEETFRQLIARIQKIETIQGELKNTSGQGQQNLPKQLAAEEKEIKQLTSLLEKITLKPSRPEHVPSGYSAQQYKEQRNPSPKSIRDTS